MNTEWKHMSGFEAVRAAEKPDMEIEVNIFDEWKPWNGEFGGLLEQVWFKDLKFRARKRKTKNARYVIYHDETSWCALDEASFISLSESPIGTGDAPQLALESLLSIGANPGKEWGKSICWQSNNGNLTWTKEDYQFATKDWKRFPAGDLEGEVEA